MILPRGISQAGATIIKIKNNVIDLITLIDYDNSEVILFYIY